jgi:hypothetical protein
VLSKIGLILLRLVKEREIISILIAWCLGVLALYTKLLGHGDSDGMGDSRVRPKLSKVAAVKKLS